MRLQARVALHYLGVVAVALALLTGLLYHEYVTEERLRDALPEDRKSEVTWGDETEALVYSVIPILLLTGWWLTRRSLTPLVDLTRRVEGIDLGSLGEPIARTGNGDEVDRLAAAFNVMAARLQASFQQIREFTLNASHELKTPLTVMRAQVETTLAASGPNPAQREPLAQILEEIDRLGRIVDGLSFLTRADAGELRLSNERVSLSDLVREGVEDARILAEPRRIRVTLMEGPEVIVSGDRHRLRQVILNLIDNAVKYNADGGDIGLAVTANATHARLEVTNTGLTIPDELRKRIFERFVRGERSRELAIEGAGLGLPIVQRIVHAHGGDVEIGSGDGLTRAVVTLPLAD